MNMCFSYPDLQEIFILTGAISWSMGWSMDPGLCVVYVRLEILLQ